MPVEKLKACQLYQSFCTKWSIAHNTPRLKQLTDVMLQINCMGWLQYLCIDLGHIEWPVDFFLISLSYQVPVQKQ